MREEKYATGELLKGEVPRQVNWGRAQGADGTNAKKADDRESVHHIGDPRARISRKRPGRPSEGVSGIAQWRMPRRSVRTCYLTDTST